MLCKYKNIFGEPGKGLHSYRIFNIAIVDLLATLLLAIIIGLITKKHVLIIFTILILISIPIHKLFCVDSTIQKLFL